MRIKRFLMGLLLVLFGIATVHAAVMGVTMPVPAAPDHAVMPCHGADGGEDGLPAPSHHGAPCITCAACLPPLAVTATVVPGVPVRPEQNPHGEASYFSFVGTPPHRPPISA